MDFSADVRVRRDSSNNKATIFGKLPVAILVSNAEPPKIVALLLPLSTSLRLKKRKCELSAVLPERKPFPVTGPNGLVVPAEALKVKLPKLETGSVVTCPFKVALKTPSLIVPPP